MRVKLTTVYSTLRRAYQAGDEIDLSDSEAIRLIERELAQPVRGEQRELAIAPAGEQAVKRKSSNRKERL